MLRQPFGRRGVRLPPSARGEHGGDGLAGQRMPESELGTASERGPGSPGHHIAPLEAGEHLENLGAAPADNLGDGRIPEPPAEHRGSLKDLPLRTGQRIEAVSDDPLEVVWYQAVQIRAGAYCPAALEWAQGPCRHDHPECFLGVEWVASRPLVQVLREVGSDPASLREEPLDQQSRFSRLQQVQPDQLVSRGWVPPARSPLEEHRSGRADGQEPLPRPFAIEHLDEPEGGVVRPLDILQDKQMRTAAEGCGEEGQQLDLVGPGFG